jgi:hypothetical protein
MYHFTWKFPLLFYRHFFCLVSIRKPAIPNRQIDLAIRGMWTMYCLTNENPLFYFSATFFVLYLQKINYTKSNVIVSSHPNTTITTITTTTTTLQILQSNVIVSSHQIQLLWLYQIKAFNKSSYNHCNYIKSFNNLT